MKRYFLRLTVLAIVLSQASCGTKSSLDPSDLIGNITASNRTESEHHGTDMIPPDPPRGLESGDWLYGRHCAGCHGQLSSSSKKGRDSQAITQAIANIDSMRRLSFLSSVQIGRIAESLSNTDRPSQPIILNGAQLYAENCASCHGEISKSAKKNATSERISSAISSVSGMRFLSNKLSPAQISEIAKALTSPPIVPTGISLYTNNCQSCHQSVEISTKSNSTASGIRRAISVQSQMQHLSFLTDQDLALIEGALRRVETVNLKQSAKMANRHQIISRFLRVFSNPADTAATNAFDIILRQEIRDNSAIFGGNCHRYDTDCLIGANRRTSDAAVDPLSAPSLRRAGHLHRACVRTINNSTLATRALTLAGLTASSGMDVENVRKLAAHFLPSRDLSAQTIERLRQVGQRAGATPTLGSWSAVMVPLCSSSATEALSPGKSQSEIYARCYARLTGNDLPAGDLRLLDIRSKKKTAIQACGELVDSVALKPAAGVLKLENQTPENLSTLKTLHRVNSALFMRRDIMDYDNVNLTNMRRNIYDTSAPALWLTRAMFSEGGRVDSIFSGNEHLSSIREAGPRPTSFVGNIEKSQTIFGENLQFAEDGNLVGIRSGAQDVTYNFTPVNRPASTGSIQFGRSFGGGILGSPVYLDSVQNFVNLKPDAATKMPRNFAKSVFNDFLCRSFPVVELNDIDSTRYVDPAAKISFRTSASCVSCHASMDRLGAVSRGIFMELVGEGIPNNNRLGVRFFNSITPDQSAETAWPVSPDANYHRRPTTGRLFFRNYRNNLLDIPLDDINSLGRVLASLDEPYICLTSRYYEYLTGISVDITYKNPENMSSAAKLHRDRVIQMGRSLKSHQNLRTTLKEIISSDSF